MKILTATIDAQRDPLRKRMLLAAALSVAVHLVFLSTMPVSLRSNAPAAALPLSATLESIDEVLSQDSVSNIDHEWPLAAVSPASSPLKKADRARKPAGAEATAEPKASKALEPTNAGIAASSARDPVYYSARQLDVYPQPLAVINLQYPDSAAAARVDGRLLLQLSIDDFGIVNDISVVEAQPPGHFEEAARAALLAMRFSPGIKDGRPVKARVQIQIRYTYGESEGSVR